MTSASWHGSIKIMTSYQWYGVIIVYIHIIQYIHNLFCINCFIVGVTISVFAFLSKYVLQ